MKITREFELSEEDILAHKCSIKQWFNVDITDNQLNKLLGVSMWVPNDDHFNFTVDVIKHFAKIDVDDQSNPTDYQILQAAITECMPDFMDFINIPNCTVCNDLGGVLCAACTKYTRP